MATIVRVMAQSVPFRVATWVVEPCPSRIRTSRRRLWKSVQFGVLRELMGGYEAARRVHFVAMALLVAFVGLHLIMVALVPRSLRAMVVGR